MLSDISKRTPREPDRAGYGGHRLVFDTRPALADMAGQIKSCRSTDGLTLQQLATRCGVAASTIHKVESQQMVPTVSVLLKIAKGLGRRPEELIRDEALGARSADTRSDRADRRTPQQSGIWRIELARYQSLPTIELEPIQRAILLLEKGDIVLQAGDRQFPMVAGDCIEIDGGRSIGMLRNEEHEAASLTLIVTPPGDLEGVLGPWA